MPQCPFMSTECHIFECLCFLWVTLLESVRWAWFTTRYNAVGMSSMLSNEHCILNEVSSNRNSGSKVLSPGAFGTLVCVLPRSSVSASLILCLGQRHRAVFSQSEWMVFFFFLLQSKEVIFKTKSNLTVCMRPD